ncbi:unnamed protein product [Bursaphelenchus xylophilus]|uniref:(pine wood nematode) hypothetical protein n=1 Tax=Bursaphelenchus xylophilus TaxID=6326 RepID=A0A1I7RU42_BURXY|nr:unnamed protein product [Bursaphelenchus xylophilus]CAG9113801.1 unnamed protein product [Bursaphelenchus xylophilus]
MTTRFEDVASFSERRAPERERKKKKRRRRNSEDDDDVGVLPRWKIVMVFAAMGICFAMLFPNVFGPIFSLVFGKKEPAQPPPQRQPDHPAMGGGERARAPRPPMPGGRMAGFENQPQQTSSRGGMFTWLMPFYTVGVMAFLIYSLMKMRSKGKKKKKRKSRYDDTEDSEESDSNDETGLGHKNLRSIQERLEETEMAMAKILEQLEEIAKIHPDATSTDDLREKYTADQVAEVENNLAELNRLSALCKKQRRQLRERESGSSESEGSEEEGFDDNLEEVEQAIKEVQASEVGQKSKKSTKAEEKAKKAQNLEQKSSVPPQRSQKASESLSPHTARPIKKANRRKRAHEKDNAGPEDDYSQDEVQIPQVSQNSESSDDDVEVSSTFVEPPSSRSSTSKITSTNVEKEDMNEPIDIILGSDVIETKKERSPKAAAVSPRSQRSKGHEFKIDDIHRPSFDDFVDDFRPQTPEEEQAAKIGEELFEPREERERSSEIPLEDGLGIEYKQRVSPDQYSGRFEYDPLGEDQEVKESLLGENDEDLIDDMEEDQMPCTSLEEEDTKLPEPPKGDDLDMDQLLQDEAKKAEEAPHIRVFESSQEICNELLSDDLPITSLKSGANLPDLAHDEDAQKSESQSTSTGKKGKNRRNKKKTSESPKNSKDSSENSSSRAAPELVQAAPAQVAPSVTVQPESTIKPSEASGEASQRISEPSADQNDINSGIECANPLFNADSGAGVRQRKSGGGKKSNIRRRVPKAE